MSPLGTLKLLREVRDLQVIDKDGQNCGICDDIEFRGSDAEVHCLLLGSDALTRRLPKWLSWPLSKVLRSPVTRVPWSDVETVTSRIKLRTPAAHYGLLRVEKRLARYLSKIPAL